MNSWSFSALGIPAPQGSHRAFVNPRTGRAIITQDSKRTKPWRQVIVDSAVGAGTCLEGPVCAVYAFTLPRPKSAPKRENKPYKKPDIEKLARAVSDAITTAGLWHDDAQVAWMSLLKVWPEESRFALPVPGLVVAACEYERTEDLTTVQDLALKALHRATDATRVSTPTEAKQHIADLRARHGL